jgi:hypothetical protein
MLTTRSRHDDALGDGCFIRGAATNRGPSAVQKKGHPRRRGRRSDSSCNTMSSTCIVQAHHHLPTGGTDLRAQCHAQPANPQDALATRGVVSAASHRRAPERARAHNNPQTFNTTMANASKQAHTVLDKKAESGRAQSEEPCCLRCHSAHQSGTKTIQKRNPYDRSLSA